MACYFVDSNIWLYRLLIDPRPDTSESHRKHQIATQITQPQDKSLIVSTQIINETCSVLKRKAHFSDVEVIELIDEFEEQCLVVTLDILDIKKACQLRQKYYFSFWDSFIVASALVANAEILYSEDMQHELTVENQLQIINPFHQEE